MRRKVVRVVLLIVFFLAVFLISYKSWQKKIMDLRNPELETVETIYYFKEENDVVGDFILIAKDTTSFDNVVNPYFGNGGIWIFDGKGTTLEANIENHGGACFQDIRDIIVKKDFDFTSSQIDFAFFNRENNFFDKLLQNTVSVEEERVTDLIEYPFGKYDFIIVYGWSKYYGMSHKNSQIKEIDEYIKSNDKKVLLIGVNVDFVDYWYPKDKPLPVIK